MKAFQNFLVMSVALLLTHCAHHEAAKTADSEPTAGAVKKTPMPAAPSIEAKQLAAENEASYVTELTFRKGKNQLSPDAHTQLSKVLDQARAHGKIQDVKVITWADAEYPSANTKALSVGQVKLATRRNDEIKRFLKNLDRDVSVTTYNMAERPGAVSELLGTSNAHIKKSLEVAGIPNTDTTVKLPAKASKSIVLVILKGQ